MQDITCLLIALICVVPGSELDSEKSIGNFLGTFSVMSNTNALI